MALSGIQLSPVKPFDQIVDYRAVKRQHLRGRNNVTSCRSPTREIDTRQIKNELKEKRHLEFLRRRSMSPEQCGLKPAHDSSRRTPSPKTFSITNSSVSKSDTLHTHIQNIPANGKHPMMILTPNSSKDDAPSTSSWAALRSDQETLMKQEKDHVRNQASTSTATMKQSLQHGTKSTDKTQKTSIKTFTKSGKPHQKVTIKKIVQETSVQTEPGYVSIKESDLLMLTDYLEEALWREEAMKKKLAALQEKTTNLMNSSSTVWMARCKEDLLRNKIKALEAQLQVYLGDIPMDGVKTLVVQMEKQKLLYEERALIALQQVTQEKTEALSRAETLQEALITTQAEALRWQSLYEELKLSSGQLRENQHLSDEQLQQLHSQVELCRSREVELMEEVVSLRRETKELEFNICLLEENNQVLREEIQQLTDGSNETHDFTTQGRLTSEEAEPQLAARRDSQVEEQLRHTQEKLRLKERECEELQTELHAMEQECQSSQARLSQCRDELRQLSHRRRTPTPCGSWWKVCVLVLLLLTVAGVTMLWLWHPPFREQAEDFYSDMETRIENYLMEMASPQNVGCFRPI